MLLGRGPEAGSTAPGQAGPRPHHEQDSNRVAGNTPRTPQLVLAVAKNAVTGVQGVHLPTWLSASSKWSQIKARKSLGMTPITRPILIQRLEVARAPGLTPSVGMGPWGRGAGRTGPGLLERPLARL